METAKYRSPGEVVTGTPKNRSAFGRGDAQHTMQRIPIGNFMMGEGKGLHQVVLTQPFFMGIHPVTQRLWKAVMGDYEFAFPGPMHPVEMVSWLDCVLFCNKLSLEEGLEEVYAVPEDLESILKRQKGAYDERIDLLAQKVVERRPASGYRLPTEAEWEYSAKAGTENAYSGSGSPDGVAWFKRNSKNTTHPVGQLTKNGFGLYDMSGNVHEWCWDWEKAYSAWTQTDPVGPKKGRRRILRGGSWRNRGPEVKIVSRRSAEPSSRRKYGGFRICRSIVD
jgi:formylglycine-generating enzyme